MNKVAPLVFFLLLLLGCSSPVAAGLDEEDANRILVALDRTNIDATKESDPIMEGKFRVMVARDDAARALVTMRDEELPRPRPSGVLAAMEKGALVPSQAAEHAQLVAGLAGDLERSLEGVDGILSARVHLNLPTPDPLRDTAVGRGSASVLLAYRGSTPPLTNDAVQRLVAGGVSNLATADVAVVAVSRPAPAPPRENQIAHVGPIAVLHASMRPLQLAMAGLIVLVLIFAAATLLLYARLSRLRDGTTSTRPWSKADDGEPTK